MTYMVVYKKQAIKFHNFVISLSNLLTKHILKSCKTTLHSSKLSLLPLARWDGK